MKIPIASIFMVSLIASGCQTNRDYESLLAIPVGASLGCGIGYIAGKEGGCIKLAIVGGAIGAGYAFYKIKVEKILEQNEYSDIDETGISSNRNDKSNYDSDESKANLKKSHYDPVKILLTETIHTNKSEDKIKILKADISPSFIEQGNENEVELQMVYLVRQKYIRLKESWEIIYKGETIKYETLPEENREAGVWKATARVKIPDNARLGNYDVQNTIYAENSTYAKNSTLTVLLHNNPAIQKLD